MWGQHQNRQAWQQLSVQVATTPEDIETAFRIRHAVYCEELRWKPPHPDGLESDRYDEQAGHVLLVDHTLGSAVGAARIVFPVAEDQIGPLPFESHLAPETAHLVGSLDVPRMEMAEISRFAVLPCARGDHLGGALLSAACLVGAHVMGAQHVFCIMEPWLGKLLARHGIGWQPMGKPVEHRGLRQLFHRDLFAMFATMPADARDTISRVHLAFDQQTRVAQ